MEMPYHNVLTLSDPVLLTVVRYCDTVLPLTCDTLLACLSPSACWEKPLLTIHSTSGYRKWMDG